MWKNNKLDAWQNFVYIAAATVSAGETRTKRIFLFQSIFKTANTENVLSNNIYSVWE